MANEKRLDLIDRNALIASCRAMHMTDVYPGWIKMPNKEKNIAGKLGDTFKRIITGAPTVDAVEVVRCKDCENSRAIKETDPNAHEYAEYCVWCMAHDVGFGKDDFCSFGERREG